MKNLFLVSLFFLSSQSFGQVLQIDSIGNIPALCRLFSYQNGLGLLTAYPSGGTSPYTYKWTDLTSMAVSTNQSWGGLNPGNYELKVWDSVGDSIVQIVSMDSVNPVSVIGVVPGNVTGTDPVYTGNAPISVEFTNGCYNIVSPTQIAFDTIYFWRATQFDNWFLTQTDTNVTFNYPFGGNWEISLIAQNKNGCHDTARVYLWLNGSSGIDVVEKQPFTIITNPDQHQLIISSTEMQVAEINVYDLSGKLVYSGNVNSPFEQIQFDYKGTFVYELIDPKKNHLIQSGKFNM